MKKIFSLLLTAVMLTGMLTGCGGSAEPTTVPTETTQPPVLEGTLEELLNQVLVEQPVEFTGMVINLDLTDTSEDAMYQLKNFTGLDSAEQITEASAYEPMIGSIAYSMVMVRTAQGVDTKTVAEAMKAGIDQRKWICVEADDLLVTAYGDVVMLIMVSSTGDMTAQSFVDAFGKVAGGELSFVI